MLLEIPSVKPGQLNMQAHFSDHGRDPCAQVSATSDCRERNDRSFGAAATNNFSIHGGKWMMIAIGPALDAPNRPQPGWAALNSI
jgi:hypothetical protein